MKIVWLGTRTQSDRWPCPIPLYLRVPLSPSLSIGEVEISERTSAVLPRLLVANNRDRRSKRRMEVIRSGNRQVVSQASSYRRIKTKRYCFRLLQLLPAPFESSQVEFSLSIHEPTTASGFLRVLCCAASLCRSLPSRSPSKFSGSPAAPILGDAVLLASCIISNFVERRDFRRSNNFLKQIETDVSRIDVEFSIRSPSLSGASAPPETVAEVRRGLDAHWSFEVAGRTTHLEKDLFVS